jgi:hypothetical protein
MAYKRNTIPNSKVKAMCLSAGYKIRVKNLKTQLLLD